jgi:hypothetical protein
MPGRGLRWKRCLRGQCPWRDNESESDRDGGRGHCEALGTSRGSHQQTVITTDCDSDNSRLILLELRSGVFQIGCVVRR